MSVSAVVLDYNNINLNGATKVSSNMATSLGLFPEPLRVKIDSTSTILATNFSVRVNQTQAVSSGVSQPGKFTSTIAGGSLSKTIDIFFTSSSEQFESYELVQVEVVVDGIILPMLSFRVIDRLTPTLEDVNPLDSSENNSPRTPIFFRLKDQGSQVDKNTLNVILAITSNGITTSEDVLQNGVFQTNYSGTLTSIGNSLDVFLQRYQDFPSKSQVEVQIEAEDESNTITGSYSFEILDIEPPAIGTRIPAANSLDNLPDTSISFVWSDLYGSFLNRNSLQLKINGLDAIKDGYFQGSLVDLGSSYILATPSSTNPEQITVALSLLEDLPSGVETQVYTSIQDFKNNKGESLYKFRVKDYKAPQIKDQHPFPNASQVLPTSKVRFTIEEDLDGYGIDFESLKIEIDGYSVLNHLFNDNPVDGYNADYLALTFGDLALFEKDLYETPRIEGYGGTINYPGFDIQIERVASNKIALEIERVFGFDANSLVNVMVEILDLGGNSAVYSYNFQTGSEDLILTTASPDTGTFKNFIDGYGLKEGFKFLTTTGVELVSNLENATIVYTLDGTLPRITSNLEVQGTTKIYTGPIYINKTGLNVLRFFAIDEAGNKESLKQEIYMIDSFPPVAEENFSIKIVADIPLATNIVPLEFVEGLVSGQLIRILDNFRPPVYTTILAINSTSSPAFILVQDQIERLKTSRDARIEFVEQPINRNDEIVFDTTKIGEEFSIGSRIDGTKQADSVIENLRILNRASTDEEILADYTLLVKGSRYFNQPEPVNLSSDYSSLEKQRVNLPDQTLVLLDFDGSTENKQRYGDLQNNPRPIVDINSASNDIVITIYVKSTEKIDRELLREILQNYAPADLNITVKYEEIG